MFRSVYPSQDLLHQAFVCLCAGSKRPRATNLKLVHEIERKI